MENSTFGLQTTMSAETDFDIGIMGIYKVIFILILIEIMFGMGCAVDYKKLLENVKRPAGLVLGLTCQIILMPVISYTFVKICNLTPIQSLALVLVGCSPGGSNSNVITYLIRGDISLSVALTSCSNILALGTVPLWILIYTSIENVSESLTIDYLSLVVTLLCIGVPIALGIFFKYRFPKQARPIPKICAGITIVALLITIISMIVVVRMPFVFSRNTFIPSALLPFFGMGLSYVIACIPAFKLSHSAMKAISVETGIQNAGIANSVLILSFGDREELFGNAVTIPLIYNLSQTVLILVMIAIYRIWLCARKKSGEEADEESEMKELPKEDVTENAPLRDTTKSKADDI